MLGEAQELKSNSTKRRTSRVLLRFILAWTLLILAGLASLVFYSLVAGIRDEARRQSAELQGIRTALEGLHPSVVFNSSWQTPPGQEEAGPGALSDMITYLGDLLSLPAPVKAPLKLGRYPNVLADGFFNGLGREAAKKVMGTVADATPQPSRPMISARGSETLTWVVYFDLAQTDISLSGNAAIREAGLWAQTNSRTLLVFGSTDTTGNEEYNDQLARRRIDAVTQRLADLGFGEIEIVPMPLVGDQRPIRTADEALEPRNRCVHIVAL